MIVAVIVRRHSGGVFVFMLVTAGMVVAASMIVTMSMIVVMLMSMIVGVAFFTMIVSMIVGVAFFTVIVIAVAMSVAAVPALRLAGDQAGNGTHANQGHQCNSAQQNRNMELLGKDQPQRFLFIEQDANQAHQPADNERADLFDLVIAVAVIV